jgi:heme oxygenase
MKIATLLVVMQAVSCLRTTTSFAFVAQNNAAVARQQQSSQLYETQTVVDNVTVLDNPRQTGMALMLDDGTRKSHSMAENTQFVTGFFKGLANRNSFRSLMMTFYYVYKAQEEAMDNTHETCVQILDYPELRRLESLKKDMEYFYGTNVSTF